LLLGDYIRDTPTLNEVVDTIRALPNCTAILGNGDIGVISLDNTKPEHCEYEQMLPNFWTYKNLSAENLNYLKSLPETADITLSGGKIAHLSHSIPLIHHKPRLGAFHSGDYARKMERSPFTLEAGMQDMQHAAEECSDEVAAFPGDICLFGHNHLQFMGNVLQKILLNPGSCGMSSDYDVRAPFALLKDSDGEVEIELHRVQYDLAQAIKTILEFNGFTHAEFWGKLRCAILKLGSDIPMSRFWQHARMLGGGVFPMPNELWRKTIASFKFDHNWNIDDWRSFGERLDMLAHYNALIDVNNDPVHDPEPIKQYMDKWDGQDFIDELQLTPDKSVLEIGVGTGRLAVKFCDKCKEFTGIDISPKTIERAGENLKSFSNATLVCADFTEYDFGGALSGSFDVVYSSLTFMHIKDKQKAINIVSNLLKPNGRFVLSTDKNMQTEIDYGSRKITVYPDKPEKTVMYIKNSGLQLEKQFATEFANIFVIKKV